jgi:cation transport regulator ChaB
LRAITAGPRKYVEPTELHHVLPQQFRSFFKNAGLDIDASTMRLPKSVHQAAHDVGWNADWAEFIGQNPTASAKDNVGQAGKMIWEYGLDKYSLGAAPYPR